MAIVKDGSTEGPICQAGHLSMGEACFKWKKGAPGLAAHIRLVQVVGHATEGRSSQGRPSEKSRQMLLLG